MSTLGDILLLLNTYKETCDSHPHSFRLFLDPKTHATLEILTSKLNQYSEKKITRGLLVRTLIHFSMESLDLTQVAASAEPLSILPENSPIRKKIDNLKEMSDIVNLDKMLLTKIDPLSKKDIIWK